MKSGVGKKCQFSILRATTVTSVISVISVKESRSSHQMCSLKAFLKNFAKLTGKYLCQSLFFNEVAGLRSATSLKKRLWHRCFPVIFAKFLRTPFLQNTSKQLVLYILAWIDLIKVSSLTLRSKTNFGNRKPFKNDKKGFL